MTDELNINNRMISERYIVGDLLGGTAIAYVHKAYDKQTSSEVAIKFLRPYFISSFILVIVNISLYNYILPPSNKARLEFEEKYYRYNCK